MTVDLLEARWDNLTVVQDFECDPHILHLLLHGILPKRVAVRFIERNSLVPVPRDFDPNLMVPLVVPPVDCRNNAVPLGQNGRHPPRESRFLAQPSSNSVLGNLDWVRLLQVS